MTEEEHQHQWPYAQGLITGASRNPAAKKALIENDEDYFRKEAEYVISRTGYDYDYVQEIAESIKRRARAGI